MRRLFLTIIAALTILGATAQPKREFRGAWLHVIGQSQWQNKSTEKQKEYMRDQFDRLQAAGCNAVIFQVRPTADALYKSDLEPWSAWLTGARGKAPNPMWDPLEYAVQEAHKRGMELHAWLNPYRVTSTAKEVLPADHPSNKFPERYFRYNGQILFNPAYQENRDFICEVVRDITSRYDVDAIHIDDYFYPYPVKGVDIPDADSYAKFGNGMPKNDWRRHNVDLLIEQLNKTIKETKPWVRFGVSPFGIWRNKANDPRGSESNGLQNYDDLYADVILWSKNGWIDYLAPQLYWNLDTKAAPSRKLAQWWNDNASDVDIYIGQDVKRTMDVPDPGNSDRNELDTKVKLSRSLPNIGGNVWWHGYWVTDNYKGAADSLALRHQTSIALPPVARKVEPLPHDYTPLHSLKIEKENGHYYLSWSLSKTAESPRQQPSDPMRYVVYQFADGEPQNLEDPEAIIALTGTTRIEIPAPGAPGEPRITYAVTALDRLNRESTALYLRP